MTRHKSRMRGLILLVMAIPVFSLAQTSTSTTPPKKKQRKGELYLSWGYNTEWYTHSNVHIEQGDLGNNFTFRNISGHDHRGWDEGLFSKALSIPQYNYRLGYIFDTKKGLGFEINFDHTKFIFADNQMVHITGTMNNKSYDGHVLFKDNSEVPGADSSSYYYLNNGANFLLFNIVKRWTLLENKKQTIRIDGFGKAGIGPVIPHVQNKFFDQPENDQHFQVGGWNIGVEGAIRATFFRYAYLEYTNKLDYARYSGLRIYKGTAKQAFGTYEMILNLGVCIPMGKIID